MISSAQYVSRISELSKEIEKNEEVPRLQALVWRYDGWISEFAECSKRIPIETQIAAAGEAASKLKSKGKVDHLRVVKLLVQIKKKEKEINEYEGNWRRAVDRWNEEEKKRLELQISNKELTEEVQQLKRQLRAKPEMVEVETQASSNMKDASTELDRTVRGNRNLEETRKTKEGIQDAKRKEKEREGAKDRTKGGDTPHSKE